MIAFILLISILCGLFYYLAVKPMSYWKNRDVCQGKTVWLFGDSLKRTFGLQTFTDMIIEMYNRFPNERYFGVYMFTHPILFLKDIELVKQIIIKDFEYFTDHRDFVPESVEPIWAKNLFSLKGIRWKQMRPILSPCFTSSKMKMMFLTMAEISKSYATNLKKGDDVTEIDVRQTWMHFANDVIASTTFGLNLNSMADPGNEFYRMGQEITNFSGFLKNLKFMGYMAIPKILEKFNVVLFGEETMKFYVDLVEHCIKVRKEKKIKRPDLIQLMMEHSSGTNEKDEDDNAIETGFATARETYKYKGKLKELTNIEMAAQAMIFFFGGFDTISSLLVFLSYELAIHSEVQDKLRKEIKETLKKCNGDLNYDALMRMKYMDMVISEGLRKWGQGTFLQRICTKPYTIPPKYPHEKPVHIEPGMEVWIPSHGFHFDPKYFANPEKFDPERFSDENKKNIDPLTYIPFGAGPRNCLGSRFAIMEAKACIFYILNEFEIVPTKNTTIPMQLSKISMISVPKSKLYLGLKKIKN